MTLSPTPRMLRVNISNTFWSHSPSCWTRVLLVEFCNRTFWPQVPLTHWPLEDLNEILSNFQANVDNWWLRYLLSNFLQMNVSDLSDDKSTLVQAMARCHHTASHYWIQCWPKFTCSVLPYVITRPQRVSTLRLRQDRCRFVDNIFKQKWMKKYEFRLKFHWNIFLRVQLTISKHWFK